MSYLQTLRSYCRPAQIYLAISAFTTLILFIQNCRDSNSFTCGIYKVKTPVSNTFYFVFQVLFTLGWAWFLNYMCRKGWSTVSWLLVIFPILGMFAMIGLVMWALATGKSLKSKAKQVTKEAN